MLFSKPGRLLNGLMFLVIAGCVFLLDQWSKATITETLGPSNPQHYVELFGNWVRFSYVTNAGAAFGLLQDRTLLFTLVALVTIPIIIVTQAYFSNKSWINTVCLGLLLGGTAGNLIDRLRFGYVVDFIDVGLSQVRWPSFNVADSSFVVGIIVLVLYLLLSPTKSKDVA